MPYAITPDGRTVYIPEDLVRSYTPSSEVLNTLRTVGKMAGTALSRTAVPVYAATHPFELGPRGTEMKPGQYDPYIDLKALARYLARQEAFRRAGIAGGSGTDADPYRLRDGLATAIAYQTPTGPVRMIVEDQAVPEQLGPIGPPFRPEIDQSALSPELVGTGTTNTNLGTEDELAVTTDNNLESEISDTDDSEVAPDANEEELEDELEAELDDLGNPIPVEEDPVLGLAEGVVQGQAEGQVASGSPNPNRKPGLIKKAVDIIKSDFKGTGSGKFGKIARYGGIYLPALGYLVDGVFNATDAVTSDPTEHGDFLPVYDENGNMLYDQNGNPILNWEEDEPATRTPISDWNPYLVGFTVWNKLKWRENLKNKRKRELLLQYKLLQYQLSPLQVEELQSSEEVGDTVKAPNNENSSTTKQAPASVTAPNDMWDLFIIQQGYSENKEGN